MTRTSPHRFRAGLALMFAAALTLSACGSDTTFWSPAAAPKANKVELVHLTHDVPFARDRIDAEGAALAGLDGFIARHDIGYGDRVYVVAGSGAPNPIATRRAEGLARALARHGIKATVLESAEWAGRPASAVAVRVLVHRFVVAAPKCPDWRKPASSDYGNTVSSNFGCANASNLGLMVADPRDLIEGRDDGLADGEREAAAIKRYREGKEFPLDKSGSSSK